MATFLLFSKYSLLYILGIYTYHLIGIFTRKRQYHKNYIWGFLVDRITSKSE